MIELESITKTYADGLQALKGVSISLDRGMFGLLGHNGAGKTTFLSILVLALEPTSGLRVYDGLDAADRRARGEIRRRIGYLPQDFAPIGHLTGLRQRIAELVEAVGLERAADRRAGEYSGGMKRRLGIAQALIHSPRLLVVDEPTAGLDPEERIRFRSLITEVAESTTVLLSTHIVEDVEATCPRLGVIAGGRLLFDGPPTELLRRANGRLWQVPAGASRPAGAVEVTHRADREGGVELVVYCESAVPGAVARRPTLEESYAAFLALQGIEAPPGEEETAA
jgi:ABC-2 type transport system ATP-binding protein